jgi:hypothetical protein
MQRPSGSPAWAFTAQGSGENPLHHESPAALTGRGHLSALLNRVLDNPSYRNNARKMQMAISEANGLPVAADLVDRSLRAA